MLENGVKRTAGMGEKTLEIRILRGCLLSLMECFAFHESAHVFSVWRDSKRAVQFHQSIFADGFNSYQVSSERANHRPQKKTSCR